MKYLFIVIISGMFFMASPAKWIQVTPKDDERITYLTPPPGGWHDRHFSDSEYPTLPN